MHSRTKKFIPFVLILSVPTFSQTVETRRTAQEVPKLYQLREFCNESDSLKKSLDFAVQKLRDKQAFGNDRHIAIHFGTSKNPTIYDPYFKDSDAQGSQLRSRRNGQVQNLRDRNSRYLDQIFADVTKYGAEDLSVWGTVQAKHDELAHIINSGDFRGCVAELDDLLPARVEKGGRQ